jgi:hypothetical protein
MIYAMLAAYRRTLQKTMAMSRSMVDVVNNAKLDWLETPDQAVVWGVALGLDKQVEDVLERSLDDLKAGRAAVGSTYLPVWYGGGRSGDAAGFAGAGAGGGGGLFSSSGIPDIGGMMASLATIGNSPGGSSSGGGRFGGGGSGGGGGGSGGGF